MTKSIRPRFTKLVNLSFTQSKKIVQSLSHSTSPKVERFFQSFPEARFQDGVPLDSSFKGTLE